MIKAVLFDLGGVVLESPLNVIANFEKTMGLSGGAVNRVILQGGDTGPWACLDRGEISMADFCQEIDARSENAGTPFSGQRLMTSFDDMARVRPQMIELVRKLKRRGQTVAALTNNWHSGGLLEDRFTQLREEFDLLVESWKVGLRKPEVAIYELVLSRLGTRPEETVFLDDFGINLKPARSMGMRTIKDGCVEDAIDGLYEVFGEPI